MAKEVSMCTQLQQWSPVKEIAGAPSVPPQVGYCFHSPKKHPWRPIMGYEEIEVTPMPSQPITNTMVDPCYTPAGMAAEPLRFPNLVTGFDRSPEHAARAALYTRYTQYEWNQNSIKNYNESDAKRNFSERVRNDIMRMLRETDEIGTQGQRDSGRRIGERITDTTFWRNEVSIEMERLVSTCEKLNDTRRQLERAISGIEGPLHIVQECLYHREKRQGLEQVHDAVEQSLLKEVAILRECQEKFRNMLEKVRAQSKNCRATQHELETDMRNKEYALGIDSMCHQLNNFSKGLQFYAGIERYDPTVCDTARWAAASAATLQRSQSERAKAIQMLSGTTRVPHRRLRRHAAALAVRARQGHTDALRYNPCATPPPPPPRCSARSPSAPRPYRCSQVQPVCHTAASAATLQRSQSERAKAIQMLSGTTRVPHRRLRRHAAALAVRARQGHTDALRYNPCATPPPPPPRCSARSPSAPRPYRCSQVQPVCHTAASAATLQRSQSERAKAIQMLSGTTRVPHRRLRRHAAALAVRARQGHTDALRYNPCATPPPPPPRCSARSPSAPRPYRCSQVQPVCHTAASAATLQRSQSERAKAIQMLSGTTRVPHRRLRRHAAALAVRARQGHTDALRYNPCATPPPPPPRCSARSPSAPRPYRCSQVQPVCHTAASAATLQRSQSERAKAIQMLSGTTRVPHRRLRRHAAALAVRARQGHTDALRYNPCATPPPPPPRCSARSPSAPRPYRCSQVQPVCHTAASAATLQRSQSERAKAIQMLSGTTRVPHRRLRRHAAALAVRARQGHTDALRYNPCATPPPPPPRCSARSPSAPRPYRCSQVQPVCHTAASAATLQRSQSERAKAIQMLSGTTRVPHRRLRRHAAALAVRARQGHTDALRYNPCATPPPPPPRCSARSPSAPRPYRCSQVQPVCHTAASAATLQRSQSERAKAIQMLSGTTRVPHRRLRRHAAALAVRARQGHTDALRYNPCATPPPPPPRCSARSPSAPRPYRCSQVQPVCHTAASAATLQRSQSERAKAIQMLSGTTRVPHRRLRRHAAALAVRARQGHTDALRYNPCATPPPPPPRCSARSPSAPRPYRCSQVQPVCHTAASAATLQRSQSERAKAIQMLSGTTRVPHRRLRRHAAALAVRARQGHTDALRYNPCATPPPPPPRCSARSPSAPRPYRCSQVQPVCHTAASAATLQRSQSERAKAIQMLSGTTRVPHRRLRRHAAALAVRARQGHTDALRYNPCATPPPPPPRCSARSPSAPRPYRCSQVQPVCHTAASAATLQRSQSERAKAIQMLSGTTRVPHRRLRRHAAALAVRARQGHTDALRYNPCATPPPPPPRCSARSPSAPRPYRCSQVQPVCHTAASAATLQRSQSERAKAIQMLSGTTRVPHRRLRRHAAALAVRARQGHTDALRYNPCATPPPPPPRCSARSPSAPRPYRCSQVQPVCHTAASAATLQRSQSERAKAIQMLSGTTRVPHRRLRRHAAALAVRARQGHTDALRYNPCATPPPPPPRCSARSPSAPRPYRCSQVQPVCHTAASAATLQRSQSERAKAIQMLSGTTRVPHRRLRRHAAALAVRARQGHTDALRYNPCATPPPPPPRCSARSPSAPRPYRCSQVQPVCHTAASAATLQRSQSERAKAIQMLSGTTRVPHRRLRRHAAALAVRARQGHTDALRYNPCATPPPPPPRCSARSPSAPRPYRCSQVQPVCHTAASAATLQRSQSERAKAIQMLSGTTRVPHRRLRRHAAALAVRARQGHTDALRYNPCATPPPPPPRCSARSPSAPRPYRCSQVQPVCHTAASAATLQRSQSERAKAIQMLSGTTRVPHRRLRRHAAALAVRARQGHTDALRYNPCATPPPPPPRCSARSQKAIPLESGRQASEHIDTENLINVSATEIWDQWSNSNSAFTRRIAETIEIKNKLQLHLHKIQQEIFDIEKTLELLNKAIEDKLQPMKVAHTRLQARTNRPHLEKCRDEAQNRLIKEVCDLQETMETLRSKIATAEGTHQTLLGVRAGLEAELRNKTTTLFIDRDQCMGLRRGYPVTAAIKS
uniref:Tektin n=1 Tax=Heliothis virescens TaxID=7102 RepID=A0A2A4K5X2_HELVI